MWEMTSWSTLELKKFFKSIHCPSGSQTHTYYVDTLPQSQIDGQLVFMKIKVVSFSSAIVAEVTQPSLGVGYEIGRAFEKKKILCLFRPDSGKRRFTCQPNVLF